MPIALRRELSASDLASNPSYDCVDHLGSYWVRGDLSDLQSKIVKYFKEQCFQPFSSPTPLAIAHAYADMLCEITANYKPSAILRVLSSGETQPDAKRPLFAVAQALSEKLNVPDVTNLFFRTEPRKPMRMITRLSGSDVLKQRINYVLQDLFVIPHHLSGTVILIDDIYNLGATASVYASALKTLCEVDRVCSINLAATRFNGGIDGLGRLSLDIDRFMARARYNINGTGESSAFSSVWIDNNQKYYHSNPSCNEIIGKPYLSLRFLEAKGLVPCPSCIKTPQASGWLHKLFNR